MTTVFAKELTAYRSNRQVIFGKQKKLNILVFVVAETKIFGYIREGRWPVLTVSIKTGTTALRVMFVSENLRIICDAAEDSGVYVINAATSVLTKILMLYLPQTNCEDATDTSKQQSVRHIVDYVTSYLKKCLSMDNLTSYDDLAKLDSALTVLHKVTSTSSGKDESVPATLYQSVGSELMLLLEEAEAIHSDRQLMEMLLLILEACQR